MFMGRQQQRQQQVWWADHRTIATAAAAAAASVMSRPQNGSNSRSAEQTTYRRSTKATTEFNDSNTHSYNITHTGYIFILYSIIIIRVMWLRWGINCDTFSINWVPHLISQPKHLTPQAPLPTTVKQLLPSAASHHLHPAAAGPLKPRRDRLPSRWNNNNYIQQIQIYCSMLLLFWY